MCRESENQRIREERERERALKYGGSDRSVAPRWGSRPRAADGTRVCLCLSVLCIHHGSPGGGGGRVPPRGNSYFGECRTGTMRTGAPSEQPAPNRGSSRGRASATFPSVRPLVWRLQTRRPISRTSFSAPKLQPKRSDSRFWLFNKGLYGLHFSLALLLLSA